MNAEREMTLDEWVGRLPEFHLAHRQYTEMRENTDKLAAEIVRLRGEVPYDRELIAEMLDDLCAKVPNSETKFSHWSMQEMARLLRAADNADAAGVRTASIAPAEAKVDSEPPEEIYIRYGAERYALCDLQETTFDDLPLYCARPGELPPLMEDGGAAATGWLDKDGNYLSSDKRSRMIAAGNRAGASIGEVTFGKIAAAHAKPLYTTPQPAGGEAVEELIDLAPRAAELATRLVASGPKAAHVSASETHEIAEFVHAAIAVITNPPAAQVQQEAALHASIVEEAAEVLQMVADSGVTLPPNWRWPLLDELSGISARMATHPTGDALGAVPECPACKLEAALRTPADSIQTSGKRGES